jgi:hypothetical protein
MGPIENVILIVLGTAFWTLAVAIPLVVFRRIGDLRRRVAHLETELRILAERSR